MKNVVDDFTLFEITIVDDEDAVKQHMIPAENLLKFIKSSSDIESIPLDEIVGRTINSIRMEGRRIVLGLSVKNW